MKGQLCALQLALMRYRNTPEVQQAMVQIEKWKPQFRGRDPLLDKLIDNLEACLKGEPMNLPETKQIQMTPDNLLATVQEYANASAKAEQTTSKFLDNPDKKPEFHVDPERPDEMEL